jgi:hypothetical protein
MAAARNNQSAVKYGNGIIIAGLFLQLAFFAFFVVVAVIFHRRMSRSPTARSQQPEIRWEHYLHTLYLVSTLIVVRSIFRVIEYIQGNTGYLLTHEVFLYIFDAVPMFFVMVWIHWRHPGEIGLLLRGEKPIPNGFALIGLRPKDPTHPTHIADSGKEGPAFELAMTRSRQSNTPEHSSHSRLSNSYGGEIRTGTAGLA